MPLPPCCAGPLHIIAHGGGPGLVAWCARRAPIDPHHAWTWSCWVRLDTGSPASCLLAGLGAGVNLAGGQRFLAIIDGALACWVGGTSVRTEVVPQPGAWHHLVAQFDGRWTLRVIVDGREQACQAVRLVRAGAIVRIAPPAPFPGGGSFRGTLRQVALFATALDEHHLAALTAQGPGEAPLMATPRLPTPDNRGEVFASNRGRLRPQDPATLPGLAPAFSPQPHTRRTPRPRSILHVGDRITLNDGWELGDGDDVVAEGSTLSRAGFVSGPDQGTWYDATVPGTVLTTLVDQGHLPDPLHGLNNLAIPDDLALRPWWYRTEFVIPDHWQERHVRLVAHGSNYHAQWWLDGTCLGSVTGAFQRGIFDLPPGTLGHGPHAVAVKIWPQPHSGLASEASRHVGPLPNGGEGTLDGPTFFCSEGWDWIPTIRDRNTGLWQGVELIAGGPVTVEDPQVITTLPDLPHRDRARLTLRAEVRNRSAHAQTMTLDATIAGIHVAAPLHLAPHEHRTITWDADHFPQLELQRPALWWPNGYGEPTLHALTMRLLSADGTISDHLSVRVGLRTVTWEFTPHLTLRVNGQRIACLGGNWGMDDACKRLAPERLDAAIRLHRDAHLTMIRNWCGQSTSEAFYASCDAYGLLVWNDFWMSTTGYNLPPVDAELLLANADDTVRRFRHHACIVLWCGRNEGLVPASLDQRLAALIAQRDGTRHYESSSNNGPHLLNSGPWLFQEPAAYFTTHGQGFSTELGVTSIPTADAMRGMLPEGQAWPLTEAWTYHDLHTEHAGDSRPYLHALAQRYGISTDLDGFCRRAQMLNFVQHRAMFEGFLSKLWKPASGLLAWMSHPAWPSTSWQFYSYDHETHGAYAGVRCACEPLHIQWNLPDERGVARIAIVNRTAATVSQLRAEATILGLDGRVLEHRVWECSAAADSVGDIGEIPWAPTLVAPVQFLALTITDSTGHRHSRNVYWRSEHDDDLHWMTTMPVRQLDAHASQRRHGAEIHTIVHLRNPWPEPLLLLHLTLRHAATGTRILPVFADAHGITLLSGESRSVTLTTPTHEAIEATVVTIDGWNVHGQWVEVSVVAASGASAAPPSPPALVPMP